MQIEMVGLVFEFPLSFSKFSNLSECCIKLLKNLLEIQLGEVFFFSLFLSLLFLNEV